MFMKFLIGFVFITVCMFQVELKGCVLAVKVYVLNKTSRKFFLVLLIWINKFGCLCAEAFATYLLRFRC